MFIRLIKKIVGLCLVGMGIGILMVLLLPMAGWLFIIGLVIAIVGFICISS